MAWEGRRKQSYYYRKKRVDGRVVSEYIGRGPQAELIAHQDALKRAEQAMARELVGEAKAEAEAIERCVVEYQQSVAHLLSEELQADGFHQRKGEWRRKRE